MIRWLPRKRTGPIGVDLGERSVKLVQFNADRTKVIDAARWELPELPPDAPPQQRVDQFVEALDRARQGRAFRGRDVVVCLNDRQLFMQNVRVPRSEEPELSRHVQQEAAGRIPFAVAEAEIRFVEAADIRQGEAVLREVIVLACHRPVLASVLEILDRARLTPVAVDVEPAALVRSYQGQFRREEDQSQRSLLVHVGHHSTAAVIAQGAEMLFAKYIDLGGAAFDAAVAKHLRMEPAEATAMRRHNGDRRADQQDPEVDRSVAEALRPVTARLAAELAMCVRYHSVTFRGQPLVRLVLGGGEATPQLLEGIGKQLDLKCELSDPFRHFAALPHLGRKGQWDVATGLALRDLN